MKSWKKSVKAVNENYIQEQEKAHLSIYPALYSRVIYAVYLYVNDEYSEIYKTTIYSSLTNFTINLLFALHFPVKFRFIYFSALHLWR